MVGSARTAPSPPPPQSLPTRILPQKTNNFLPKNENHKIAFTYLILVSGIYTQARFKLENLLLI